MRRPLAIWSLTIASLIACPLVRAAPLVLPDEYKDDGLLDDSASPDGHYGLMCIRREVLDASEDTKQRLYLVAMDPFHVLTEIPVPTGDLLRGHSGYVIKWRPDGSAVLIIEQGKWGPYKVYLVPIHDGKAGQTVDLTAEVDQRVGPDFKKSAAARFNDYFAYIFEDGSEMGGGFWWAQDGAVAIDCYCNTDPKGLSKKSWAARFRGAWDVAKERMTKASFERMKR